jgi:16S rRNA processing protein RimM
MEKIYVAKLGKSVGLKGQQKIFIDSDFPEQFQKDSLFFTNKNKKLILESFNKDLNIVKFKDINTIDEAKKLTNTLLYVSKDDTKKNCKLEENQYFWFDLIDCNIVEDGEILGKVADIQRLPLDDYFIIHTSKKLQDDGLAKSFMLPYQKEYIKDVNIELKIINTISAKDILEQS